MKTVQQALKDEIHYPISEGFVENVMIKRNLKADDEFDYDMAHSDDYQGAVADCLWSLVQAINFLKQTSLSGLCLIKTRNVFCYVLTLSTMLSVSLR